MPLSIKSAETEQLARQVAQETGESLTEAVQKALQERLDRLHKPSANRLLADQLDEILRRVDALPILDDRPAEEILGYDDQGLPG